MQTMTYRTTFALDEVTAQRLKRLAACWHVSQAEVVRRSVEQAEKHLTTSPDDIEKRLETARQLRASLKERGVDVAAWITTARDSRSLPDCIIAASAIASKAPLATLNLSDFHPFLPHGLELV